MTRAAAILSAMLLLATAVPALADDAAKAPTLVVGRTTAGVVSVLVDVTDTLTGSDPHAPAEATLRRVELAALDALNANAARLPHNVQHAQVSVIYQRIGAVNPMYKTATFAGVERLLTMHVGTSAKDRAAARAAVAAGRAPAGLVTVTGKLPGA